MAPRCGNSDVRDFSFRLCDKGPIKASACTGDPLFAPRFVLVMLTAAIAPAAAFAGGPKYIAGTAYFNPAVVGQPVRWSGGVVNYYIDQGPLNGQINNQQATAMVDTAAALWSAVPTAGVRLTNSGSLTEDVSGSNVIAGNQLFAAPSDVAPSATSYPLAVIYDIDGSIINGSLARAQATPPVARTMASSHGSTTFSPTPPSPTPSSSSTASARRTRTLSR